MKKVVANKIFLTTLLAMLIFAGFSVFLINYLNVKMVGENLKEFSYVYADNMENMTPKLSAVTPVEDNVIGQMKVFIESVDINTLRLVLSDESGNVIADNGRHGENVSSNISSDLGFSDALNGSDGTYLVASDYYSGMSVIHYKIVSNDFVSSRLVLRVEMLINYSSTYFIIMIPIIVIVLILVMVVAYMSISSLVAEAINPLVGLEKNLLDIESGKYHYYDVDSRYQEVKDIVNTVNNISEKLSNNYNHLKYEKEKTRFILDHMSQGVIAVDSADNLIMINDGARNIFKVDTILFGDKISESIKDPIILSKLAESSESAEDSAFDFTLDGKTYRVELNIVEEKWCSDSHGNTRLLIFNDVTNEIESAKIRSEFFANASHELKTPLTAIQGFSSLLELYIANGALKEEDLLKCSGEISKNTKKMLDLINDMLKISKMDANLQDEMYELVDLNAIATEVIKNIESIATNKNITISLKGNGKIIGDKKQIDEVFTNLISNAIKYNNEGGYVDVRIKSDEKKVTVTVKDNGIGIAREHHNRIFERFYRVDKSRDAKANSTGLGLSIVKHIVTMHKGKIGISSRLGHGTTFTIEFPTPKEFDTILKNN